jgi:4-hydroxy-tetrahydrodipicolinate synthase
MSSGRPDLICAAATPLQEDLTCHRELFLDHCRHLLAHGCNGVVLFGTTGEGPYFGAAERRSVLEFLLERDLAPARVIVGAGSASLSDTVDLTRHALSVGIRSVLLMPPFFLRAAATEAGVFRFYAETVERAADPELRLLLYNFPAITGVTLSVDLVRRLRDEFGDVVAGVKDSGGDWQQTAAYLEGLPELAVYTGTEVHARRATSLGGVGTICGLANVLPQAMRRYLDATDEEAERWHALISAVDEALCVTPFLPACKAAIGLASGADDWRRVLPPSSELDDPGLERLARALRVAGDRHELPVGQASG